MDHLQKRVDTDIGHFAIARLQCGNGRWGLLNANELDIDALGFEIAQLGGQIHYRVWHKRCLEMGDDQAERLTRLRETRAGHQGQTGDRSGQSQHH